MSKSHRQALTVNQNILLPDAKMDGFVEQDSAAFLPYGALDPPQQHLHHYPTWPPLDIMSHNNNATAENVDSNPSNASSIQIRSRSMATTATTSAPMLQTSGLPTFSEPPLDPSAALITTTDWQFQLQQPSSQQAYTQDTSLDMTFHTGPFGAPLQSSPIDDFLATTQGQINNSLASSYLPFSSSMEQMNNMAFQMQDFHNELMNNFSNYDGVQPNDYVASVPSSIPNSSPGENWLDARSLSSRSDHGWTMIDHFPPPRQSFESYTTSFSNNEIVVSPHNLHVRTGSDSSHHSDVPLSATLSAHSWEDIPFPISPEPEPNIDYSQPQQLSQGLPISHDHDHAQCSSMQHSPNLSTVVQPLQSSTSSPSSSASPSSGAGSPTTKRRKTLPTALPGVSSKTISKKKPSTTPTIIKDGKPEKKVGKRRGPLKPEQRQSAHEIRKLRACLRCKFLKKVCDKGDPCGGCQPSHTRLWQVPCTRIDIKELAYFLKDWNADYERHVTLGFSVANIKGFSTTERLLYITHGYGFYLPITAREVYVRDEKCFGVDWVESIHETPRAFDLNTAKLSAGMEGVSHSILSEYLDKHIDGGFEHFVDEYFEGTAFLTEILKTVYRYYLHSKLPVIRKALKLVVAYGLTLHITLVSGLSEDEMQCGKVEDEGSRYHGQTVAPVMINFQIKKAMADTWRELMKDILEELSALFSSVYSGEKHKNWPTIFMLAAIILCVWELMQFDCHYRVPDQAAVQKFCTEMESTPVGVIVGLFSAISTKLPSFLEWDTKKHHHLLNSNPAVCDAMSEVRTHVEKYEPYLKSRNECKFDRNDFDSLSNKFLSRLVIRA